MAPGSDELERAATSAASDPEGVRLPKQKRIIYRADGREPAQIRADAAATRARMSGTMRELRRRLAPQRLQAEAREVVRGAAQTRAERVARRAERRARHVGTRVAHTVRRNALPVALLTATVALSWLVARSGAPREGDEAQPTP